jgi:hypothetical protein
MTPLALLHPEGSACAELEDTRRAKRLFMTDGTELVSAHLSSFAFESASAGAELIRVALRLAGQSGLPAMFVAVAEQDLAALQAALDRMDMVVAPATVYGAGLEADFPWNVNTSEI